MVTSGEFTPLVSVASHFDPFASSLFTGTATTSIPPPLIDELASPTWIINGSAISEGVAHWLAPNVYLIKALFCLLVAFVCLIQMAMWLRTLCIHVATWLHTLRTNYLRGQMCALYIKKTKKTKKK